MQTLYLIHPPGDAADMAAQIDEFLSLKPGGAGHTFTASTQHTGEAAAKAAITAANHVILIVGPDFDALADHVLFEIGYALASGKPLRVLTYQRSTPPAAFAAIPGLTALTPVRYEDDDWPTHLASWIGLDVSDTALRGSSGGTFAKLGRIPSAATSTAPPFMNEDEHESRQSELRDLLSELEALKGDASISDAEGPMASYELPSQSAQQTTTTRNRSLPNTYATIPIDAAAPNQTAPATDPVEASIYAAAIAPPDDIYEVQVFLHTEVQRSDVDSAAIDTDSGAEKRARKSLRAQIARGTQVTILLQARGETAAHAFGLSSPMAETLTWTGEPDAARFYLDVPADAAQRAHVLIAVIMVAGVPIGEVSFKVRVKPADAPTVLPASVVQIPPADTPTRPAITDARAYTRVFMSYAREDIETVTLVARSLSALQQQYFWDIDNLRAGDDWEAKIYEYIDTCDAFFLFWSDHARQSDMVRKETERALKGEAEGRPISFVPFPIQGPPVPRPWDSIAARHIGDPIYYRTTAFAARRTGGDGPS